MGVVLAVIALVAGALGGRAFAPPEAAIDARVVTAGIAQPIPRSAVPFAPTASRPVLVGVPPADIETDATALLARAATQLDPAEAAHELLPAVSLAGPADTCADSVDAACPAGLPATVVATPAATPPSVPSGEPGRPPTSVFALTETLVAVSVPHRDGERVLVQPSVILDGRVQCNPVDASNEGRVHPLPVVESTIDPAVITEAGWSADFTGRTTASFAVGEGLTVYLCAQVFPANSREPNYRAEALLQTADRLVPTVRLESVSGVALPGWTIEGYLADGEACGAVRVPTVRTFTPVALDFAEPRVLCGMPGAGFGDTFTVAHSYLGYPAEYTSLDLGAAATCAGSCVAPVFSSAYAVVGSRASATISVEWSEGETNGAVETQLSPILEPDLAGGETAAVAVAEGDEGTRVVIAVNYRVSSDSYSVGVSRTAAYLTVRSGSTVLLGPREGQCFGDQSGFLGDGIGLVLADDSVRLSGSLQTVGIAGDALGCVPEWATAPLAITFEAEIPLQELRDNPGGVTLSIDQPVGSDPSVRATASALLRVVLVP